MDSTTPLKILTDEQSFLAFLAHGDHHLLALNPKLSGSDFALLEKAAKNMSFSEPHLWIASSGTTATSERDFKLIALSRSALRVSARGVNQHLNVTMADRWFNLLPLFHVGGLGVLVRSQESQSELVPSKGGRKWIPQEFKIFCEQERITITSLVPTQVFDLVHQQLFAPTTLRCIVVGGGSLDPHIYHKANALGWNLLPSFGMSEVCSQIATALNSNSPALKRLPHIQWDVVKQDSKNSSEGFLKIQSKAVLSGHWSLSAGQSKWTPQEADDWFTTKDYVSVLNDQLEFIGRSDDQIKISGENVNLSLLRQRIVELSQLMGVSDYSIALVARTDLRHGHKLVVVYEASAPTLQRRTDETKALLDRYNSSQLPFERIHEMAHVPLIPRNAMGKFVYSSL